MLLDLFCILGVQNKPSIMKKIYYSLGVVCSLLLTNNVNAQQKITEAQIQPILTKLKVLGQQNPMGGIPLEKLQKEEYMLFMDYQRQKQEEKRNPYGITQQDLKNKIPKSKVQPILDKMESLTAATAFPADKFSFEELKLLRTYELQNMSNLKGDNKAFTKAYAKDSRQLDRFFGTLPLSPPMTLSTISSIASTIYCDDVAGNGKLYAINNDNKTLVRITPAGTEEVIGNLGSGYTETTATGLSWNSSDNKMYLIGNSTGGSGIYTVDLTTGVATSVGTISGLASTAVPIWLEIDNAGNAFIADIQSDSLYKLNLTSGAATLVGALGININFAQEADFNRDTNELYMAGYLGGGSGGIYKVNTSTGAATLVGDTTANNQEYTMYSIADSLEPPIALNKAYFLNVFNNGTNPREFGTIPLTPPHTVTSIAPVSRNIFADDLAGDGILYGLDYDAKTLVKIFSNGTIKTVGALAGLKSGQSITGLSWDRTTSKMYALAGDTVVSTLYTVDLTTGAVTVVGDTGITIPIWLEISNDGNAYSADNTTDNLYSINLTTGVGTVVGPLGIDISYAQDADFDTNTNKLYMAAFMSDGTAAGSSSGIYEVNLSTGAATFVGDTNQREITMFTIADSIADEPPVLPLTCGDNFTDTGGTSGNYSDSEDITTVIQPVNAGDAVKITFTQVEIETSSGTGTVAGCWDYLSIYNGPDISSPVLAAVKCGRTGGTPSVSSSLLSVGDSFTSTDPSGKLTVRFRSDSSFNYQGWQATVSCATMAVDEANANSFSYYPNPTSGILNISSKSKIESLEVFNLVGQKVMTINPKDMKSEINMSQLKPGVYMVKATVNGKVITNKVIKK